MNLEAQTLAKMHPSTLVAGVDEVGRGALFGPVVAAAVVIPATDLSQLNEIAAKDSKKLSAKRREALAEEIKTVVADVRIGYATAQEIDEINILQASLKAMQRAIKKLTPQPNLCFVDGRFKVPDLDVSQVTLTQGDARSRAIAAASIIAKVWRDDLIVRLWGDQYPQYHLAANKGYGTSAHRLALQEYGPSPQHRLSFRPCRQQ
ncbi:MAG: ribonuclease HII [Halothece sp. Uz-M2-17]|nr:ribonuclease HII [Halothece sp. Uz-M2-17]